MVTFGPLHPKSDQWGFLVHDVYGAYTPVNKEDNRTRIIFLDGIHSCVLFGPENKTDNTLELWISLQGSIITKFDKAEKGTQFKGWQNAKEYKNTDSEIAAMIAGRIFMTELKL